MATRKGTKIVKPGTNGTGTDEFVELTGRRQPWTADELRDRIRREFADPEFQRSVMAGMVESFEKLLKEDATV
jgi:hypothetical protein